MASPQEASLLEEDRQLSREISRLQQLLREIPALVIMPKAEEALARVRKTAAELALPAIAAPPILARLGAGSVVRTAAGVRGLVLAGGSVASSPAREVRLVITETGEVVTVPVEELIEAEAATASPPSLPEGSPQSPPEVTTAAKSGGTLTTLRPGDKVVTPQGEGVIISIAPGAEAPFEVEIPGLSRIFYGPADVKPVATPSG